MVVSMITTPDMNWQVKIEAPYTLVTSAADGYRLILMFARMAGFGN